MGAELLTAGAGNRNLDFSIDAVDRAAFLLAYDWGMSGSMTGSVSSNVFTLDGSNEGIYMAGMLTGSKYYDFNVNITGLTGTMCIKTHDGGWDEHAYVTTTGEKDMVFQAPAATNTNFYFYGCGGVISLTVNASVINNSLKQITNAGLMNGVAYGGGRSSW